jgi:peptidoglycan/xylan/chitin deacetylase (PgdA/CDA1 family)
LSPHGTLARKGLKAATLPFGVAGRMGRDGLIILLYHRVGPYRGEISLPLEVFKRQLEYLRTRTRVLSLEEALRDGSGGSVVVTFDDGYPEFHDKVLPLLEGNGIPAVLYLCTGLVQSERPQPADEGLTWAQLREVVDSGLVTVGAHTHGHANLSRLSEPLAEAEMRRSKELIEDRLGVACRHFAYPFAVGSANSDRAARRLFDTAALHAWRTNRVGRLDPYRLGRVPVLRSDGPLFFSAKVRGLLNGEALAYRLLRRGPWKSA